MAKNRLILVSMDGVGLSFTITRVDAVPGSLCTNKSANNIWYTGAQAKWIRFNKIYLYALTVD